MFTRNTNPQASKLLKLSSAVLLTLSAANVSAECVTKTTNPKPVTITKNRLQCLPEADQFLVAVADNNLQRVQQFYRKQFPIDYRSGSRELIKFVNVRADKQNRYVAGRGRYEYASGTAYDIALSQGYVDVAKWLIAQGANPAAGFFQRQIKATDFAKYYPSGVLEPAI